MGDAMVRTVRLRACCSGALGFVLVLALGAGSAGAAGPGIRFWNRALSWTTIVDNSHARIAGSTIVWQRGTGTGSDVLVHTPAGTHAITNDGFPDELPETDGTVVVWQHSDGNDTEVDVSPDGSSVTPLTNNDVDDSCPATGGGYVGWQGTGALGPDFFASSLAVPDPNNQITGDAAVDGCPIMSGSEAVWVKTDGLGDIWYWSPALDLFQITDSPSVDDSAPAVSSGNVVWVAGSGSGAEILYWNTTDQSVTPLTLDSAEDGKPQIDGNRAVWQHFDGHDFEIYQDDMPGVLAPFALTDDGVDDHDPQVSGDTVVWVEDEPTGSQIWTSWHGGPPEPVTNDAATHSDPRVAGEQIVFQACGGSYPRCEIMMAPEPGPGAVGAAAAAGLALLAGRRRQRAAPPR
jgi:MYXO-CTERM domain-containing protein